MFVALHVVLSYKRARRHTFARKVMLALFLDFVAFPAFVYVLAYLVNKCKIASKIKRRDT